MIVYIFFYCRMTEKILLNYITYNLSLNRYNTARNLCNGLLTIVTSKGTHAIYSFSALTAERDRIPGTHQWPKGSSLKSGGRAGLILGCACRPTRSEFSAFFPKSMHNSWLGSPRKTITEGHCTDSPRSLVLAIEFTPKHQKQDSRTQKLKSLNT